MKLGVHRRCGSAATARCCKGSMYGILYLSLFALARPVHLRSAAVTAAAATAAATCSTNTDACMVLRLSNVLLAAVRLGWSRRRCRSHDRSRPRIDPITLILSVVRRVKVGQAPG